ACAEPSFAAAGDRVARASFDRDVGQRGVGLRELRVDRAKRLDEQRRHVHVADPVVVGGHDVPRRPVGGRLPDHLLVGLHELVPACAVVEISAAELPRLLGVLEPVAQPLALLFARHVQEDLDDRRSLVDEHALELPDLVRTTAPDLFRCELVHAHGDDVLVVRPVEDPDLAAARRLEMDAPEVVVREIDGRRLLERDDPAALRVHAREDAPDRAVLPRRVEPLQDEEHAALRLRVQAVVQHRELLDELREPLLALGLVAEPGAVAGIPLVEPRLRAGLDSQLLRHAPTLHEQAVRLQGARRYAGLAASNSGRMPSSAASASICSSLGGTPPDAAASSTCGKRATSLTVLRKMPGRASVHATAARIAAGEVSGSYHGAASRSSLLQRPFERLLIVWTATPSCA